MTFFEIWNFLSLEFSVYGLIIAIFLSQKNVNVFLQKIASHTHLSFNASFGYGRFRANWYCYRYPV